MANFRLLFLSLVICFLAACAPSAQTVQAGTSKTQATWTPTPSPTFTPTPTPTSTPTPTQTLTLAPTLTPTVGIGSKWVRPADGMQMVYVPAGQFNMGSNTGEIAEMPMHSVYLDAFWIDQTEVTNGMYARCVKVGACGVPISIYSYTRLKYYGNSQYADYPVIYVDWNRAQSYCKWAGARLPSEAEWEKAARGTDERVYPWGNTPPTCSLANYSGCVGDTAAVGNYPSGASPYGALDMAGNVIEWVNDWYDQNYYSNSPSSNPPGPFNGIFRVLRGSSWDLAPAYLLSALRSSQNPDAFGNMQGFRCSLSLP